MKKMPAIQLLREYAALQERLCDALFDQYPVDDANLLTDLPAQGTLPVGDDFWEFQRHGSGVCFTQPSTGQTVDAHADPVAQTKGIDAWRLVQYLESKGIEELVEDGVDFDATSERSLQEMLEKLHRKGSLVLANQQRRIYSIPSPA